MSRSTIQSVEQGLAQLGAPVQTDALPIAQPRNESELQAILALAAESEWRVLPCGLGSTWPLVHLPEFWDLGISTCGLEGDIQFDPGEGVLTAPAGTPWSQIQDVVEAQSGRIAPYQGLQPKGSLGGLVALGLSGPERSFVGALRHRVLGLRVMLADGSVARIGGKLVKNVTGFDLPRLWTGSRGSLGVILEASLRVAHAPAEQHLLRLRACDLTQAAHLCERFHAERIPCASLQWNETEEGAVQLEVWCIGSAGAMQDTLRLVRRCLDVDEHWTEEAAQQARAAWAGAWRLAPDADQLVIGCQPSEWPALAVALANDLDLLGIPYAVRALPGCAEARVRWPHLPDAVTPALQALQDGLEACHASWQWFGTHAMAGTFGPAPAPGLAWAQESLRRQFDPQGRFQPRPRA